MECSVKTKEIMKKPIIKDVPKFVSNASKVVDSSTTIVMFGETMEQAIERTKRFREGYIIGLPMATKKHSVQQLKDMGMIGLYHK